MLVKFATQLVRVIPYQPRIASNHERKIVPVDNKEFRYLRFRAIGNSEVAGQNGNFDSFPYEGFEDPEEGYGYKSFIGKRAHAEHNSTEGLSGSIGDLPDAYLNGFNYPEDFKEKKWSNLLGNKFNDKRASILSMPGQKAGDIEVLMRIDTTLVKSGTLNTKTENFLKRITRAIDTGQILTCSMGTNVMESSCSVCGNMARFSSDYCNHLKSRKGALTVVTANEIRDLLDKEKLRPEWLKHLTASKFDVDEILKGNSNKGIAMRNVEFNYKLSFFELSIVGIPAYPAAKQLEKIARKGDESRKEYLRRITKEFGDDTIIDLYELLQEEGKISSMCMVN